MAIAVNGVCVDPEIDILTPPQWEAEPLNPFGDGLVDAVGCGGRMEVSETQRDCPLVSREYSVESDCFELMNEIPQDREFYSDGMDTSGAVDMQLATWCLSVVWELVDRVWSIDPNQMNVIALSNTCVGDVPQCAITYYYQGHWSYCDTSVFRGSCDGRGYAPGENGCEKEALV